jgi:hypothetical protein
MDVPVKEEREEKRKNIPSNVPSEEFISWWSAYGKVGSRADANGLYQHWRRHGATAEALIAAATNYRAWCIHTNTSQKHGSTFLAKKPNRWEEHVKPEYDLNGNSPAAVAPGQKIRHLSDVDDEGLDIIRDVLWDTVNDREVCELSRSRG